MIKNLAEFKEAISIYEVISSYIPLKKSGSNYSACCPFHNEKTPSFVVSETKGIYHCYGCDCGGDGIAFVMEYEKLSFEEACKKIAELMNFSLEFGGGGNNQKIDKFLLEKMRDRFVSFLDEKSKSYLLDRGLSQESIEKWKLGYCPLSFELLKSVPEDELNPLIQLGVLAKSNDGKIYSPFSGRIIFPISNASAKVVAFGGRVIEKDKLPKYLNSKESFLYLKKNILFGLHLAKTSISQKREVLITEGYLDVIMLHQYGFTNAIATCGTALSKEHIASLSKLEAKIVLLFDNDNAGKLATQRAINLLLGFGIYEAEVMMIQGGKDPCELLANNESDKITQAKKIPIVKYCLLEILKPFNLNIIEQKNLAILELKKFFLSIQNKFIAQSYISKIASYLQVNEELLYPNQPREIKPHSKSYDYLEASIIKAMAISKETTDYVVEWIDKRDFSTLGEAFESICLDKPNAIVREILLDELIFLPSNILQAISLLRKKSLERQIQTIKNSKLPTKEKLSKITDLNNELKKYFRGKK